METIHITMPDGAIRDVPRGTTAAEIAQQISPRLAKEALVARIQPMIGPAGTISATSASTAPDAAPEAQLDAAGNGEGFLVDLRAPIDQDVKLSILTPKIRPMRKWPNSCTKTISVSTIRNAGKAIAVHHPRPAAS